MDGDRASGDPVGADAHQPGEPGAGGLHRLEAARAAPPAGGGLVGKGLDGLDGPAGQQPATGAVQIRGLRRELGGRRLAEAERRGLRAPSLGPLNS
ncbi:hypothetical protein ACVWXU_007173 [Streptomyces sp. TE33382]